MAERQSERLDATGRGRPSRYLGLVLQLGRTSPKRLLGWSSSYVRFLLKMAVHYPGEFFRHVLPWTSYALLPMRTRPAPAIRTFHYSEVDKAVAAFQRDGAVILSGVLEPDEVDELYRIVKAKADELVRLDELGLIPLPPELQHGFRRYSFGEWGHSPEWEYMGHNERVLPVLKGIWEGYRFRSVAAGGDFVLPGGEWQVLHSDIGWKAAGEENPRILTVNYYVTDVGPENGPIRLVPGTARFPKPLTSIIGSFEPSWMKGSVITGKRGDAVIRDPRVWHGGTPNTSDSPRYMPNIEYTIVDAPEDMIVSTAALEQLSKGRWMAEFSSP